MPADDTIPRAPQSAHRLRLSSAKILIKPSEPIQSLFFLFFSFFVFLRTDLSVDTATLLRRRSSPALTFGDKVRNGESKRMKGSEQEEHIGANNAIVLRAS